MRNNKIQRITNKIQSSSKIERKVKTLTHLQLKACYLINIVFLSLSRLTEFKVLDTKQIQCLICKKYNNSNYLIEFTDIIFKYIKGILISQYLNAFVQSLSLQNEIIAFDSIEKLSFFYLKNVLFNAFCVSYFYLTSNNKKKEQKIILLQFYISVRKIHHRQ